MTIKKFVEDIICGIYKKAILNLPEDVKIPLENALQLEMCD